MKILTYSILNLDSQFVIDEDFLTMMTRRIFYASRLYDDDAMKRSVHSSDEDDDGANDDVALFWIYKHFFLLNQSRQCGLCVLMCSCR